MSLLGLLLVALGLLVVGCTGEYRGSSQRIRCDRPGVIPNGSYRLRGNNMLMRISCNSGYQLQGYRLISCIRGKWSENRPVCTKKGCRKLPTPANGQIHIESDMKAILYCSDEYNLAGNRFSYCNGTDWDRPIGNCRERKNTVQHECDFETDDVCGWVYEQRDGLEWKRVMAANVFSTYLTGPRYDHTTLTSNGGHYMLMESLSRVNIPVTLTSPVYSRSLSLKTACCFQFYYFMYGAGVGSLLVVLKPISIELSDILDNSTNKYENLIKFRKTGNQNNLWNEAHFNIEEMSEGFQIVFVAIGGQSHLSDIAIDDVRLMTGQDCRNLYKESDAMETSTDEFSPSEGYASIYDMQSCASRCNDANEGKRVMLLLNHLIGLCSCHPACEDFDTCCIDYKTLCLNELFMESTTFETKIDVVETPPPLPDLPRVGAGISFLESANVVPVTMSTVSDRRIVDDPVPRNTTPLTNLMTQTTTTTTFKIPITSKAAIKPITNTSTTSTSTTPTTTSTTTTTASTTTSTKATTTTTTKTTPSTSSKAWTTLTPTTTAKRTTRKFPKFRPPTANPSTTKATTKRTYKAEKPPSEYIRPIAVNATYEVPHSKQRSGNSRGSTLLIVCLTVIVAAVVVTAVYRRYGDRAAAWSMIYFSPGKRDADEASCLATAMADASVLQIAPSNSPAAAGNGLRSKTKFSTSKLKLLTRQQNEMSRPLWQDDEDDDEAADSELHANTRSHPGSHNNGKLFTQL